MIEVEERILWQPPPSGMVKLNWDAAVDAKEKIIGLGIVGRDEKGSFLAALSKQMRTDISPVGAEIYAALHAVQFCIEQCYSKAWFEGDALQVVKEVNSELPCESMHGHLTEAIKEHLQGLNQAILTHTRREANAAAHELAVEARTHVIDTVRWTSIPPCICCIVRREESLSSL
ncbi:uncharacterized protein LOC132162980 [Corylus avellana]|uniref:uncharacterized protein LOC132162980 n=1 Tax=Corylus avellana TaxID=13451 RepID=UPI00286D554F|nr:uncharacterized protein LOC132162980 [Corylus avellana]